MARIVPLSEITDVLMVRQGLFSVRNCDEDGAVFNALDCLGQHPTTLNLTMLHDWSMPHNDIPDEPPYQFCHACGNVQAARHGPVAQPRRELIIDA